MKNQTFTRSMYSASAMLFMLLAVLTLSLGASAQRQRPAKKSGASSRDGSKSGSRAEKHAAKKKAAQRNAPKRKPNKKQKPKAQAEPADAPAKNNAAAMTALQNRRTLEDDKHLTRAAVLARLAVLAKAGWRKAGEDEEAATKRAADLAAQVKRLETMEGDRHRKTLARFQAWTAKIEQGETVPALMPADAAAADDAPDDAAVADKAKGKKGQAKAAPRKKRAVKAKPRAGGERRGRAGSTGSGGRRR